MDISENDLTNKNNGADGVIACLFLFFFWFRGNILGYIYIYTYICIYIYMHITVKMRIGIYLGHLGI